MKPSVILSLLCAAMLGLSTLAHAAHHNGGKPHAAEHGKGLTQVKSKHSVAATADKLEAILKEKGMTVFARIDHSAGAKKADLELRPTQVVIFGNPKVGTPLMKCEQTVAIDLPQKMLIWEDEKGVTWLAYNTPSYLKKRHHLKGCDDTLKKVSGALKKFATAATQ